MKKVIFYLIEHEEQCADSILLPHEKLACEKIVNCWQNGLRVLVACQDQQQAEKIDEFLWQQTTEFFVPHNLVGEGMSGGAPVEIAWLNKKGSHNRHVLINMQEPFPEFASMYNDIIDFVPKEERLKTLARERYKTYKNIGFNLKTITV